MLPARRRRRALLALLLGSLACEASGFETESVVDTLRVLAIEADLPIAVPGETVHLSTLWADPLGNGRPISWAWGVCVNPGATQIPACAAQLRSLSFGGDAFDVTVPADALDGLPPSAPIGEVGVVFAACAGTLTLVPNATGAPVSCTDAKGNAVGRDGFVWGGRRIIVVQGFRNQNPTLTKIFFDGVEWSPSYEPPIAPCAAKNVEGCPVDTQHVITYQMTQDSQETYGAGLVEDVVGWFYVSQGSLADAYLRPDTSTSIPTFQTEYAPTLSDTAHPVQMWFVLRDDRGGVTFAQRRLSWR
ncbi:MAG TPA: hypothetical protein VLM85_16505 [Polyangiaceae bacterium]|nr:hypothetical protein [Polyangiaceae bacterium]